MTIGLLTLEIHIPDARSLKDKRQILRSLKDRLRTGTVIVTEVRLTPGMRTVRVFVQLADDDTERATTLAGLKAASGYVRHELVERLRLRRAPEVIFMLDESDERGQRIEQLLRQVQSPRET